MNTEKFPARNRLSVILLVLGLVLAGILMALPLYSFTASVYTKKSSNTFVGDEKYQEVRAEVEAEAENFRSQGMNVDITETDMTGEAFADYMKDRVQLAIVSGGEKFFGPGSEGHVRICFATSRTILAEGLDRLERGLRLLMEEKQA